MTGELTRLEGFLDTIEHGEKPDDLDDVAGLERWAGGRTAASESDLARARELRESLREVLRDPDRRSTRGRLAAASRAFTLRAGDPTIGEEPLVPDGSEMHSALGRVVADYASARATGAIVRLKLCANCGWAFVDLSRNRSRRWCEMTSCGNQSKVRTYRTRRRATISESGPKVGID